jgi:hypothetical protein
VEMEHVWRCCVVWVEMQSYEHFRLDATAKRCYDCSRTWPDCTTVWHCLSATLRQTDWRQIMMHRDEGVARFP